jgi:hypothetical protein
MHISITIYLSKSGIQFETNARLLCPLGSKGNRQWGNTVDTIGRQGLWGNEDY